ncbi:hypothetical protein VNO80_06992 [Phaseolus coccineus]|uniref:Uncharacterized protein n=1 Tax=Phaseolus coccineus TaxID=3886 RepID=A0AAN9RJH1_PHACN
MPMNSLANNITSSSFLPSSRRVYATGDGQKIGVREREAPNEGRGDTFTLNRAATEAPSRLGAAPPRPGLKTVQQYIDLI